MLAQARGAVPRRADPRQNWVDQEPVTKPVGHILARQLTRSWQHSAASVSSAEMKINRLSKGSRIIGVSIVAILFDVVVTRTPAGATSRLAGSSIGIASSDRGQVPIHCARVQCGSAIGGEISGNSAAVAPSATPRVLNFTDLSEGAGLGAIGGALLGVGMLRARKRFPSKRAEPAPPAGTNPT